MDWKKYFRELEKQIKAYRKARSRKRIKGNNRGHSKPWRAKG